MTDDELNAAQLHRWIAYDLHALLAAEGDQKFAEICLYAEILESLSRELKAILNNGGFDASTIE